MSHRFTRALGASLLAASLAPSLVACGGDEAGHDGGHEPRLRPDPRAHPEGESEGQRDHADGETREQIAFPGTTQVAIVGEAGEHAPTVLPRRCPLCRPAGHTFTSGPPRRSASRARVASKNVRVYGDRTSTRTTPSISASAMIC